MRKTWLVLLLFCGIQTFSQNSLNKVVSKDSISKFIGNGVYLTVTGCIGDEASQKITLYFTLTNPVKAHQKIKIDPWSDVPLGAYDNAGNQFPFGTVNLANQTGFGQIETEVPTGVKVKGYATFINVYNKPKALAHISIPITSGNWPSASDLLQEIIEINNVPVNWDAKTFPNANLPHTPVAEAAITKPNFNINFCNGLDFYFTGCVGDAAAQTATLYFVIANYNKTNQKVSIDPNSIKKAFAFDNAGNKFPYAGTTIANESSDDRMDFMVPAGLFVKGSIKFVNILPTSDILSIVGFDIATENWNGSGGAVGDEIQLKNIQIKWNGGGNPNDNFKPTKTNRLTENEVTVVPNVKKVFDNSLDFTVIKCEGDSVNQSVIIYYQLSNPNKPHQTVDVFNETNEPLMAFDKDGNQYKISSISLGEGNSLEPVHNLFLLVLLVLLFL